MVAPGEDAGESQWQHKGYGEELLTQAEETARPPDMRKLRVTSGIGVRIITGNSGTSEKDDT